MKGSMKGDKWIEENILAKRCTTFHPVHSHDGICCCGRDYKRHVNNRGQQPYDVWSSETHTTQLPTNVYGSVHLNVNDEKKNLKYVRISDATKGELVEKLLYKVWRLQTPRFAVSLISNSFCEIIDQDDVIKMEDFLAKFLKSTTVWFISGATRMNSTTKLFNETFNENVWKERSSALLGFASWARLSSNRKKQLRSDQTNLQQRALENYFEYSHLLFADNGTKNDKTMLMKDDNYKLKTSFERYLLSFGEEKTAIPTTRLLLGGHIEALDEIYDGLLVEPRLPVVLFPSLGGLSQIMSDAKNFHSTLKHVKMSKRRLSFSLYVRRLLRDATEETEELKEYQISKWARQMFFCFETCSDLIFVNKRKEDMTEDIFTSFLAACQQRYARKHDVYSKICDNICYYRLKIAIMFGELDEVSEDWLGANKMGKQNRKRALLKAMLGDRVSFVRKFLNGNVKNILNEFSDDVELAELYYKKALHCDSLFHKFLSKKEKYQINTDGYIDLRIPFEIIWKLVDQKDLQDTEKLNMAQKLIFWAVLNNHQSLAKYFWQISQENMLCTALIAAAAYKSMAKLKWFATETRKELKQNRDDFEQFALRMLTFYYRLSENNAKRFVLVPNEQWEKRSILQIARRFKFREVIAHDVCQDIFNQFWKGKEVDKILGVDEEQRFRLWVDIANKRTAQRGHIRDMDSNHMTNSNRKDDDVSDDDLTYITKKLEERKTNGDEITSKTLKERLFQNGGIPYEKTSFTSLRDSQKKINSIKKNRVASAPNLKDSLVKLETPPAIEIVKSNNSKVKFMDDLPLEENKITNNNVPLEEKSNVPFYMPPSNSIDNDRVSNASSKSGFSSLASTLYSPTHNGSRKLSKARRYTRLQMLAKGFVALFMVPRGKFFLHCMIFGVFLGLFSYFLLTQHLQHEVLKWVLLVFVVSMTTDEMHQMIAIDRNSRVKRFHYYIKTHWNVLDILSISLFYTGFILRAYKSTHLAGVTILSVDVTLWYIKVFQFYRMSSVLGPYIVMMWRMVRHLMSFLLVLLVVILAYGVFQRALLYMDLNTRPTLVFQLLYNPFLLMFGELNVNDALDDSKTVFETVKRSEQIEIVVAIGFCFYLFITNILLLNLLIAVFNNIYEEVKDNADIIWKFERTEMILEYLRKPPLPMPFSMFLSGWSIIKAVLENCFPLDSPVNSEGEKMEFSTEAFRKLRSKEKSLSKLFLQEYEKDMADKDIVKRS